MPTRSIDPTPVDPVEHILRDGVRVRIRSVRPQDRALLARGFHELSPESRYRRFFTPKQHLTDEELRYLTEVDGFDHLALGALGLDAQGNERPLGIARYIRHDDDPAVAEAAVAVADAMQGKGLGKLLLHALSDAAHARGVRRFRCTVLADNPGMRRLLRDLDPKAHVIDSGSNIDEIELDLPTPNLGDADCPQRPELERLLRMAAEQQVEVRSGRCP